MAEFTQRDNASDQPRRDRLPQSAIALLILAAILSFIRTASFCEPDSEVRLRMALPYFSQ
jgi:hypothetical protein